MPTCNVKIHRQKKRPDIFDDRMAVHNGWSHLTSRNGYTEGDVVTRHGIVTCYAQGSATEYYHSRLDFVYSRTLWIRNYGGRRYSERGLSLLAKRFADGVVRHCERFLSIKGGKALTPPGKSKASSALKQKLGETNRE